MTTLKTKVPLTVLYRGNLKDTAVIVGLSQVNAAVSTIAYTGELDPAAKEYLGILNRWLRSTQLPQISIHPLLSASDLERLLECPLNDWGWRQEECKTAIRLAGLPLPPLT